MPKMRPPNETAICTAEAHRGSLDSLHVFRVIEKSPMILTQTRALQNCVLRYRTFGLATLLATAFAGAQSSIPIPVPAAPLLTPHRGEVVLLASAAKPTAVETPTALEESESASATAGS